MLSLQASRSQQVLPGISGSITARQSRTLAEQFGACSRGGGPSCLLLGAAASTTSVWKTKSTDCHLQKCNRKFLNGLPCVLRLLPWYC